MSEHVFQLNLYGGPDGESYCGCWHEPVVTPGIVGRLNAAGFGAFCPHDGPLSSHYPCTAPSRAFFFGEELHTVALRAQTITGCRVDICDVTEKGQA